MENLGEYVTHILLSLQLSRLSALPQSKYRTDGYIYFLSWEFQGETIYDFLDLVRNFILSSDVILREFRWIVPYVHVTARDRLGNRCVPVFCYVATDRVGKIDRNHVWNCMKLCTWKLGYNLALDCIMVGLQWLWISQLNTQLHTKFWFYSYI